MQLNHLHFRSPKIPETLAFYERYFGFEPHVALGSTVVLVNPERFYLAMDPAADGPGAGAAEALHFGFCLGSSEGVRELHRRMADDSVSSLSAVKEISANAVQFYCLDPTGNRVEVGWYRPLPPLGALAPLQEDTNG